MSGAAHQSRELRAFAPALVLLAIFALINFIDRGNLSIAAPLLKEELRISASELGILLSAFFWTYTAMQFVSGWIVDSFDVNRVITAGFLLWSLATAATGLVRGFTMLLVMRLMLGVGESVMSPAYSKILSFHLPEHHRGFANGVLQAAVRSGPAVGTLGTGLLIAKYGWRPAFVGIGLVSSSVDSGLDQMDATRRSDSGLPACIAWFCGYFAAAVILGCLRRSLSCPLLALFHAHLAAVLSRARTSSFHAVHGQDRQRVLPD